MIIRKIEPVRERAKLRVAAYARVSTAMEEQQESFDTQVRYYTDFINACPDWEFVEVYVDSGRTGTSVKHRPGFLKMIDDAKTGRIDLIFVKSISRFARNVVDAQRYVHELKAHRVEVRFEREGISSFDPSSDMLFSFMAAVAQEESRDLSEHVKWTYRKNAEKGIRRLGSNRVLGYDEIGGQLTPNKDAWIVKMIFEMYAEGAPFCDILSVLKEKQAKRVRSDQPFSVSSIQSILINEIYAGDRCIQKTAPRNYLTKKPDRQETFESYYISKHHEAIIGADTWVRVQERLKREKQERTVCISKRKNAHFLYGKVLCVDCGAPYTRRTLRGKEGPFKAWECVERLKGKVGNGCKNRIVKESEILQRLSETMGVDASQLNADACIATLHCVNVSSNQIQVIKVESA